VSTIYLEGGGDSQELKIRCREGFKKLLEKCAFKGRMPKLVACGGRESAFDRFKTGHTNASPDEYVAMLIDSEDPVADHYTPWAHLRLRDGWEQPSDAEDNQVLLMTTCMETWILVDRAALARHYGAELR
jgi:hypothetical protein